MKGRGLKLLFIGALGMGLASPAYADPACDAEVAAIQAELDGPPVGVSSGDLEQATILFDMLSANCAGGSTLEAEAPTSQQIRFMLGMGES